MSVTSRPFPHVPAAFACALALTATLAGLSACATDRLAAAPPRGIDLTGEWQVNANLSDDPQKMPAEQRGGPGNMRHHRGRGGGGSGGLPPFGLPGGAGGRADGAGEPDTSNFTGTVTGGFDNSTADAELPTAGAKTAWAIGGPGGGGGSGSGGYGGPGGAGGGGRSRGNRLGHLLDTPDHLSIEQNGGKLTIQRKSAGGDLTTEVYTAGEKSDVPMGEATAERTVGWKGAIFVIDTKVKSGPSNEEDFALDDDGRLIVSTLMSGGRLPKIDFKRVYDRVKGAQGVHQ